MFWSILPAQWCVKCSKALLLYFIGFTIKECSTQRQRGEVDGVAVGPVAPFISSSDLEGVDGAGDHRADGHRVGLTVHTRCTVHI